MVHEGQHALLSVYVNHIQMEVLSARYQHRGVRGELQAFQTFAMVQEARPQAALIALIGGSSLFWWRCSYFVEKSLAVDVTAGNKFSIWGPVHAVNEFLGGLFVDWGSAARSTNLMNDLEALFCRLIFKDLHWQPSTDNLV